MLKAIALGTLAQSALLLSGLLVYWVRFPPRFVGVLAGFGAGALIEAVSFDLVAEATNLDSLQFVLDAGRRRHPAHRRRHRRSTFRRRRGDGDRGRLRGRWCS